MKKIINYYINEKETIHKAMSVIQSNLSRSVVVVNDANKVVGVFSEGDVLRAILSEVDIFTPLKEVMNRSFCYLNEYNIHKAFNIFKKKGISLIPIVDKKFRLKEIITILDILNYMTFTDKKEKQ